MRLLTPDFIEANGAESRQPRFVFKIHNDIQNMYITSHDDTDIDDAGALFFSDELISFSGSSQKITPERGYSTIGGMSFSFVDEEGEFNSHLKYLYDVENETIHNNRTEILFGYKDLPFDDFALVSPMWISGIDNDENSFSITLSDTQRFSKKKLFDTKPKTIAVSSIGTSSGTVEVISTEGFERVYHDENWSDSPSASVGYLSVTGEDEYGTSITEILSWSSSGATSFVIKDRGLFGTRPVDIVGTRDKGSFEFEEVIYLDMPVPKLILALQTGDLYGDVGQSLPDHWHAGMTADLIDLASYENIGEGLWDFNLEFIGTDPVDAKKFIAEQCMAPLNLFNFINQNGEFTLKNFSGQPTSSLGAMTLNYDNLISAQGITRDFKSIRNTFAIKTDWKFQDEYYARNTVYIDADSIDRNNFNSQTYDVKLQGIRNRDRDSGYTLNRLAEGIRSRFSEPVVKPSVVAFISDCIELEIGDIVTLDMSNHPDYASVTGSLLASFEVQGITYNFVEGTCTLDLFGSSGTATPIDLDSGEDVSQLSYPASDGWLELTTSSPASGQYQVTGSETSEVLTITGNESFPEGRYYYAGDIRVSSGVTLTIDQNFILGFRDLTILAGGFIDGKARGAFGANYFGLDSAQEGLYTARTGFLDLDRYYKRSANAYGSVATRRPAGVPTSTKAYINSSGVLKGFETDLRGNGGGRGGQLKVRESFNDGDYAPDNRVVGGAGIVFIGENFFYDNDNCIDISGADNDQTVSQVGISGTQYAGGAGGFGWNGSLIFYQTSRISPAPALSSAVVAKTGAWREISGVNGRPPSTFGNIERDTPSSLNAAPILPANYTKGNTDYSSISTRSYRVAASGAATPVVGVDEIETAKSPIVSLLESPNTPRTPLGNQSTITITSLPQLGDDSFDYAVVTYRAKGQSSWVPTDYGLSSETTVTVPSNGGIYEFKSTAINGAGKSGGSTIEEITVVNITQDSSDSDGASDTPPVDVTVPDIKRLELVNRIDDDENWNQWKSPDAEFRWAKLAVTTGGSVVSVNGATDPHLEGYKIKIKRVTGEILREEMVKDSFYTYTFDENKKDTNGSPVRDFIFDVQGVTTTGYVSAVASIEVGNPAPDAPSNVTSLAGFTSIMFTYELPVDTDFVGIDFYILEGESGDVYVDGSATRISGNTFNPDGLNLGTTYQIGATSVDQFGSGGSISQFGITTAEITSSSLGDITTPLTLDESGGRIITNNSGYYGIMGVTTLPDVANPIVFAAHDALAENTVFYIDVNGNAYFSGELGAATGTFGDVNSGQYMQYADGQLTFGPNATIGDSTDRTVTVGPAGDYLTMNDALTALSKVLPAYKDGGFTATIMILSGVEIDGFTIDSINLGWTRIESENSNQIVNGDIVISNGARSPVIACDLDLPTGRFYIENGAFFTVDGVEISSDEYRTVEVNDGSVFNSQGAEVKNNHNTSGGTCVILQGGSSLINGPLICISGQSTTQSGLTINNGSYASLTGVYFSGTAFSRGVTLYSGSLTTTNISRRSGFIGSMFRFAYVDGGVLSVNLMDIQNYATRGVELISGEVYINTANGGFTSANDIYITRGRASIGESSGVPAAHWSSNWAFGSFTSDGYLVRA